MQWSKIGFYDWNSGNVVSPKHWNVTQDVCYNYFSACIAYTFFLKYLLSVSYTDLLLKLKIARMSIFLVQIMVPSSVVLCCVVNLNAFFMYYNLLWISRMFLDVSDCVFVAVNNEFLNYRHEFFPHFLSNLVPVHFHHPSVLYHMAATNWGGWRWTCASSDAKKRRLHECHDPHVPLTLFCIKDLF